MRGSLLTGLLPLAAARAVSFPQASPTSSSTAPLSNLMTLTTTGVSATTIAVEIATPTLSPVSTEDDGVTAYVMVGAPNPTNGASTLSPAYTYYNPVSSAAIASASFLPDPMPGSQHCGKNQIDIKDTKGKADHFQLVVMKHRKDRSAVTLQDIEEDAMPIVLRQAADRKNNIMRPDKHVWIPTFHANNKTANESTAYFNLRGGALETDDKLSSNHKKLRFSLDADPKINKKDTQTFEPVLTNTPFDPIGAMKKSNLHAKKNWLLTRNNYTYAGHRQGPEYYTLMNSKREGVFVACAREKSHWIEPVKKVERQYDFETGGTPLFPPGVLPPFLDQKFNLYEELDRREDELDVSLHYGTIDALKNKAAAEKTAWEWCTQVDLYAAWDPSLNVHGH